MKKYLSVLFFFLLLGNAQATTWYAGTGGSDSNDCTGGVGGAQNHGFRKLTVAAGLACMSAAGGGGHTLYVTAGTYSESGLSVPNGTSLAHNTVASYSTDTVTFTASNSFNFSNTARQYVDIVGSCTTGTSRTCKMNFNGPGKSLDNTGAFGISQTNQSSNILFDGVRITNWGGVAVNIGSTGGITFRNSRIDNNGWFLTPNNQAGYAFYIGGSNITVDNCELDNQGGYAIHQYTEDQVPSNNTYRNNLIHDNGQVPNANSADGILIHGISGTPTNNRAYNNIVWNNALGYGIRVQTGSGALIYGNTVYNNGNGNGATGIHIGGGSGAVVINNIVSGNAVQIINSGSSTTFSNNLCSAAGTGCAFNEASSATFNSPGSDFTLKAGSAALNAGFPLSAPYNVDILGITRPQGGSFDIGAYEAATLPVVTITSPTSSATYNTSSAAITVSGTSDLSSGVISWTCDRCTPSTGSTTTGTINAWTLFPALTLKVGINILTVTATATAGGASSDTLTITYAPTFPGNSLALSMGFENGSGSTVTDLSGNANTGTLVGSPTWLGTSGGRYGNAVQFDGFGGQYMTVADANSLDFTQSLTISMWVKPSASISNYSSLVAKVGIPLGPPYRLFAGVLGECGTGGISGFVLSNGASGPENQACHATPLAPNVWTHVAFTYDGANLRLYKNGALMTTTAHTGYIEPSTGILYVARSQFGEYFAGAVDELRIYNHAIPRTTTNNATFGAACSAAEEIATPSVVGDANCPLVPLAPPLAFKVSATSTIKLGADQTQKIGGTQP